MFSIDCDVIFKELIIHLNVRGGILMVIHDHEKINTYSKTFFFQPKEKNIST